MLNLNKNKLIPATEIIAYWGEIKGDISKQTDLVELTTDLDTSIKGWVESKGYVTAETLPEGIATESWVTSQGYLTEHQDLTGYALKSEIPSLTGYATEQWVTSQGYLTEHQDLSSYAQKSEIPSLDGYATESWVTSQGYVTAETFPEGIATESWVNEQNYVSDPNNDLAPLFNKENGYLRYNLTVPGYNETWIEGGNFPATFGARYVFNVKDEVYNYVPIQVNGGDGKIYKFNEESDNFEQIATAYGAVPSVGYPMWVTPDGVVRYGISYTVNLQTGQFENWEHNSTGGGYLVTNYYQSYLNSIDNVILGTNGRPYVVNSNLDQAFVWDYNTNDFTIQVPVSGVPTENYFRYHCYFNGKYLCVWNSVIYEFVEHFNELGEVTSVSFEVVSTPYFPLKTVNKTNINIAYVKQLQSSTVYIEHSTSTAYQLIDGVWTVIKVFKFDEVPGKATSSGCVYKDYLFGYGYSTEKVGMIPLFNFGLDGPVQEFYGWYDLDSKIDGINSNIQAFDSRIFTLETNYGDALNITNQILG